MGSFSVGPAMGSVREGPSVECLIAGSSLEKPQSRTLLVEIWSLPSLISPFLPSHTVILCPAVSSQTALYL